MPTWARALALAGLAAVCWVADAATGLLDWTAAEQARIVSHGPWPPAVGHDRSNRLDGQPAAQAYGRWLFHSARLSIDGQRSCASCHQPGLGFQDGHPVAQGLGPGLRNTSSLWDAAGQRWFGWGGSHDSLWSASLAPLISPLEMGHSVAGLATALRADADWSQRHRAAMAQPLPPTDEALVVDLAKALAAYQATLVSPRTAFDDFRDALARGDRAAAARYPQAAQRGLRLFLGEGRCAVCHTGPSFSNGEFADIGRPFFVAGGVDPGRHRGLQELLASPMNRLGRYNDAVIAGRTDPASVPTRHLLIEPRHFGEFKVPGLRQLRHTAPYMHDGSAGSLAAVVRHYSELNEDRLHADGERILRPLNWTPAQTADMVAFLESLSSPAGR